jgi:tRNA-splicing ligase RtcB
MRKDDLQKLGVPNGALDLGMQYCSAAAKGGLFRRYKPKELIERILADPQDYFNDSLASRFAKAIVAEEKLASPGPAPYKVWGENQIDLGAIEQLRTACNLPVAVKGALMPDAHIGYGLPIGGVLATANSVIPYAVGVDIACRMKLTVLDIPETDLDKLRDRLKKALIDETQFGIGCTFEKKREHPVMDKDWNMTLVTKQMKDTAWSQLGTSGGGNHFVEFGVVKFFEEMDGIEKGSKYLALMSHSGSRGVGSRVCDTYSRIATKQLPKKYSWAKHLAWLDLDSEAGQEYWNAMNLMGDYASANHECIHRHVSQHLGAKRILTIENHHNFAWKEIHDGAEYVVHRKGATPAASGVLGVIPGSMADPAYVVRGTGNADSLKSASHGAGRKLSRNQAKEKFNWTFWRKELANKGIDLMSAGIDEVPGVYKNINEVMAAQSDLVETIARFKPKIVRMAEGGLSED